MTILEFTREKVKAMAQAGLMNIKSVEHWDVCKFLSEGHTAESAAERFRIDTNKVVYIRSHKCPCSK